MTTGVHIKDKNKRLDARRKRDTCLYYSYHVGGCLKRKILACGRCLKYKRK
jgi:hypothetical protein